MSIAIAVAIVLLLGLAILLHQGAKDNHRVAAELEAIEALSVEQARNVALRLLNRPGLFQWKPASGGSLEIALPASVSELLAQYDEVQKGEFWVARHALSQRPRLAGYLKLGEDFEFTEILLRAGDDRVFVAYGEQRPGDEPEAKRSVWHLIVEVSGETLELVSGRRDR